MASNAILISRCNWLRHLLKDSWVLGIVCLDLMETRYLQDAFGVYDCIVQVSINFLSSLSSTKLVYPVFLLYAFRSRLRLGYELFSMKPIAIYMFSHFWLLQLNLVTRAELP